MSTSCLASYSPDLLYAICSAVYHAALPPPVPSLDPMVSQSNSNPIALPSSYPPPNWPEPLARKTLHSLCLLNKAWHDAAKPWLYRKVEVRLPRNWLAFVDEITSGEEDDELQPSSAIVDQTVKNAAVALAGVNADALRIQECVMETLAVGLPDGSIPPELLSPPASRDPSPRRAKSPGRWRLLRSVTDAVETLSLYAEKLCHIVPTPHDHRPGRHTRSLDFNHFRTIGMRRSVDEGMNSRYVTGDRVNRVLQEMVNLEVFGATEYMDGALTLPVLSELLLRGRTSRDRGRARPRNGTEDETAERRKECKAIEALDFCGCVSSVFVNALDEFVNTYLGSNGEEGPLMLPGLQRLGLRGVRSVPSSVLTPFVLAFPSLTHLDLSGTLCAPELLDQLANDSTLRLTSFALGRCSRLTSASITNFLINGRASFQLKELSLYGDMTFRSVLNESDLLRIINESPCFTSGKLQYLDLSSCPLTCHILKSFSPQLALRSLGLAHIPTLSLADITAFMISKSPNVEILTLVNTSPELSLSPRQATLALHSQLIQPTAPFSFSITPPKPPKAAPTRLRGIELSMHMLGSLGAGAGAWRIVRSKGGRGWYVDTASGWVTEEGTFGAVLRRDLPPEHPFRVELGRLSDSNGNVSSVCGWHARKMEILHGQGMLGREDGLYGAVSFAYHA
ncbi:hypothetical protein BU17DRAFT_40991 [Hysterangium stoloniferum]|nr:hypothetical protein BU17DRAFT_40991 [Hysterangium stoloniferum]